MKDAHSLRSAASRSRRLSLQRQHLHSPADIFVGKGFRFWLTGLRTGELVHWERAFLLAEEKIERDAARNISRDFSQWVRLLSECSRRDLRVLPPNSRCFCRDECVAMAVIAAHQHKACPAIQACAMTLLECEPSSDVVALSESLADQLSAADQVLSSSAMTHVVRYAANPGHLAM